MLGFKSYINTCDFFFFFFYNKDIKLLFNKYATYDKTFFLIKRYELFYSAFLYDN